jgi:hypothetical protein
MANNVTGLGSGSPLPDPAVCVLGIGGLGGIEGGIDGEGGGGSVSMVTCRVASFRGTWQRTSRVARRRRAVAPGLRYTGDLDGGSADGVEQCQVKGVRRPATGGVRSVASGLGYAYRHRSRNRLGVVYDARLRRRRLCSWAMRTVSVERARSRSALVLAAASCSAISRPVQPGRDHQAAGEAGLVPGSDRRARAGR